MTTSPEVLSLGMVGGGAGSQIGPTHQMAARLDGLFRLTAGALDVDAERGRTQAVALGISPDRAYGDWRRMLDVERQRADRLDLVTVATPNSTHYEIARAFLDAGFNVLCEKPLTTHVADAVRLREAAAANDRLLAVNFCYAGYGMVHQAREMVEAGELGDVRVVVAEFAHGFHADAEAGADDPRVRWRYDPAEAGNSAILADCGIHALHLATFVTGQCIESLSADFAACVPGRQLEDDAHLALRLSGGVRGRLWASSIAVGNNHGLTLRVYGSRGGLRWAQESPNQLYWTPLHGSTQVLERGGPALHPESTALSRVPTGHPEGFISALGNIYRGIHGQVSGTGVWHHPIPDVSDGEAMVRVVHAAACSADAAGVWVRLDAV
ncbi:MAG: Gfo/Idh/MocA family oxidoreductase [Pseudomonadota bacterium]